MKRWLVMLLGVFLISLALIGGYGAQTTEKESKNKYLLVSVVIQPLASHSITLTESQADCLAQGKAFLDWADKSGIAAGFNCLEVIPGSKPNAKLDKDGHPIHFQKERDL